MDTIARSGRIPRPAGLGSGRGLLAALITGPLYVAELLCLWVSLSRQRRHLAALDERLLKDIGLTRADVEGEVSRRFWDY